MIVTWKLLILFICLIVPEFASALASDDIQAPLNATDLKLEPLKSGGSEFSDYVIHLMDVWSVKGISITLVRPDSEPEYGAWGKSSEDGEKVTKDTLFNIASCSKAFLSASMGNLMDDYASGKNSSPLPDQLKTFDWETKVKDLLPDDWKLQDYWASEKTNVQDLLSHSTGMPRHDASYGPNDSPRALVRRLQYLRPAYELRQEYAYNNQMFIAGSHIISSYAGSYIDYTRERIFKPLGMRSTTFSPATAMDAGSLSQSWTAHSQRIPYWFTERDYAFSAGAGGIITSAVDLSKWIRMLLNSGVNPNTNETVVPLSAFRHSTTAHIIASGDTTSPEISIQGYGMGWRRESYQGHDILSHGGAIPGFSSSVAFLPGAKLGIAVLANTGDKGIVVQALTLRLVEIALGLRIIPRAEDPTEPYPTRPPRPENTNTTLPLESYSGTYANLGYGTFTLCDPAGSSFYCNEVLSSFNAVDNAHSLPYPPPRDIPQLFGAWPRILSTHIRLIHFENDTFDVVLPALFPEGYGQSKTPFETYELDTYSGKAEFVVQEGKVIGFGFFGTEPEMRGRKGNGIDVQEGAIAWFTKV